MIENDNYPNSIIHNNSLKLTNMKNIKLKFFTLCFFIFVLLQTISSQDLYVYSLIGVVKEVKGRVAAEVSVRQILTMKSVLNMGKGSQIVLIDPENSKQYTLSGNGTSSVQRMIARQNKSTKDLKKMYLSYLMKQLSGKGVLTSRKAVDGGYASIEREMNDSVFIDMDIPDSLKFEK